MDCLKERSSSRIPLSWLCLALGYREANPSSFDSERVTARLGFGRVEITAMVITRDVARLITNLNINICRSVASGTLDKHSYR